MRRRSGQRDRVRLSWGSRSAAAHRDHKSFPHLRINRAESSGERVNERRPKWEDDSPTEGRPRAVIQSPADCSPSGKEAVFARRAIPCTSVAPATTVARLGIVHRRASPFEIVCKSIFVKFTVLRSGRHFCKIYNIFVKWTIFLKIGQHFCKMDDIFIK